MIGPSRPTELAGLCAEWLADLGSREVYLHWTPDAPELLDSIGRVAPTLVRGIVSDQPAPRLLGWPVLPSRSAPRGSLLLTSDPDDAAHAGATLLPLIDPHPLGLAPRRFLRAVDSLRRAGRTTIALYGAGKHTRRLCRWIAQTPEIAAIIDDRAGEPDGPGSRLWGLPVIRPERIESLGITGVIVSSDEYERTMLAKAGSWGSAHVVGMYQDLEAQGEAAAASPSAP